MVKANVPSPCFTSAIGTSKVPWSGLSSDPVSVPSAVLATFTPICKLVAGVIASVPRQ
jgi:hypothetical protein